MVSVDIKRDPESPKELPTLIFDRLSHVKHCDTETQQVISSELFQVSTLK